MKKFIRENIKANQYKTYLMAAATGALLLSFAGVTEVEAAQTLLDEL